MKRFTAFWEQTIFDKQRQSLKTFLMFTLFISTLFLAACSGKLGTIEHQDVDTQISQAEQQIRSAREANAASLAFEEFEQAETYLEQAKEALNQKNGVEALKFANQAIAHAKLAKRKAVQNTTNAEFNAKILEKDALITELRRNINANETKRNKLQTEIQNLRDSEMGLKDNIRSLENDKRKMATNQQELERRITDLTESIKAIQADIARSENEVKAYGNQVKQLTKKLDVADTMVKSESKQKRAAIAEAAAVRKQMREQAKIYTDKLATASKRNIAAEHAEFIKKAAEEARAFEKQLHSNEPKRTGRTSLSTQQINAGKAALSQWYNAWNTKNLDTHFGFYTPNITTNKIHTIESKENQSSLNSAQMEKALREMNAQTWKKFEDTTEVEQDSVIGTYRFRRLVSPAETEDDTALYDIWFREVWMHQVQGKWKAYREIWQIYPNVPKF